MFDLVIRGGTVIDGSGSAPRTADIAVKDGVIVSVEGKAGPAAREVQADGALVAPGWVDIHTHYDGQATWDQEMAPSSWHGVTTVVMGNCGVGFAPAAPDRHEWLIGLMEGVEDIPEVVLTAPRPAEVHVLNGQTGDVVWNKKIADYKAGYSYTATIELVLKIVKI